MYCITYRIIAGLVISTTCLGPGVSVAQEAVAPQAVYQVGGGDVLNISVYGTTAYNAVVQVATDGQIAINELGNVQVGGLSPAQIGEKLANEFKAAGILIDPVVNVLVQEYRSKKVSVFGTVGRPGEYILDRSGLKLTDVLARAGAQLGRGGGVIQITDAAGNRTELPAYRVMTGELDRVAQADEIIMVADAPTFFILGEVRNPGAYPLEPGLTIEQAVALAGGLTPRGARNKLKVTRTLESGEEVTSDASRGDDVQPRDLIRVGARIF